MAEKEYSDTERAEACGVTYKPWHGMPSFMCPHCQYDDLNLNRLLEHVKGHALPLPKVVTTRNIVDTSGNNIEYTPPEGYVVEDEDLEDNQ